MGTAFREQVKDILAAFSVFVEETLSREKLSGKAEDEKNKLKKLLDNIKEEFPALKSDSDWSKDSNQSSGSTPNLYDSAAKSQAVPASEILAQAKISGFLKKKSDGLMGKPKKKWCGIKDETFYIYEKSSDKKQKGQIDLSSASVKKYDGGKKAHGFEVSCPSTGNHLFFASNETELNSWLVELGAQQERIAPPVPADDDDDDDQELYEEVDTMVTAPKAVKPSIVPPKAQPAVADDDDDDIYEDDFITPVQPVRPSKPQPSKPQPSKQLPSKPLPAQPVRPDSEIYEDTADLMEDEETYDDVEANPVAPIKPLPRKVESKPISAPKKPLPEPPVFENLYYALWSRMGDQPDELSFSQADILLVRNKVFDKFSWWAAEINGKVGYVPKNFLTPVYVPVN